MLTIKEKKINWTTLKFSIFCSSKYAIRRVKSQPSQLGKVFAAHVTDKGLIKNI